MPDRFPDLGNHLHIFVSVAIWDLFLPYSIENIEDMSEQNVAGCEIIKQKPDVLLERLRLSIRKRLDCAIEMNGRYMEHFM